MTTEKIINVASVPQRSPFRYPGGKTWLVPEIRAWLNSLPEKPEVFIEPFAGGGIASLTVAFEGLAGHVVMVEKDVYVSAVWKVILEDADWLASRILEFDLNIDNVQEVLSSPPCNLRDKAFQAILRNRVQRGGIMALGASLIKSGENGRGISSRWYPETLAKRIRAIYDHKNRITFIEDDAMVVIPQFLKYSNVVFFLDPPYTIGGKRAGSRLYTHNAVDHEKLFSMMANSQGYFLLTYDDADEVKELSIKYDFSIQRVLMKNTHHKKMHELLITPQKKSKYRASI